MNNLTEQWKNGELEWDREYYVDLDNSGKIKQLYLDEDGDFFDGMIEYSLKNKPYMEVLAPVPSYNEYMSLVYYKEDLTEACKQRERIIKKYQDIDAWWKQENQKLKDLMKECREAIEKAQKNYGYDDSIIEILEPVTTKIDEVLNVAKD